jgi:hypothetical protein
MTLALLGGEWLASRPCRFTPRESVPGMHWIGGWIGPRADLEVGEKRKIPVGNQTPAVQSVARPYTDCAIPAHYTLRYVCRNGWKQVIKCMYNVAILELPFSTVCFTSSKNLTEMFIGHSIRIWFTSITSVRNILRSDKSLANYARDGRRKSM